MADIDENLVTFLTADAGVSAISTLIAVGWIPDADSTPYVWVSLQDEEDELDLDGSSGYARSRFDIECCSDDIGEAKDLGKAVKTALDGYRGTFGTTHSMGAFVETKDDDYLPLNADDDDQICIAAMGLMVQHAGD